MMQIFVCVVREKKWAQNHVCLYWKTFPDEGRR